jgi:CheY-like chemotaxis protein
MSIRQRLALVSRGPRRTFIRCVRRVRVPAHRLGAPPRIACSSYRPSNVKENRINHLCARFDELKHADSGSSAQVPAELGGEAQQLQTWEDEGGQPVLSPELLRILIVDNDVRSSDLLGLMLRASGHETRVAHSGNAALAIAAEFKPDVVLLEINLPDRSGYEVGQLLRERAQRHELRLIALTSSREHAGRELARVAGFERYLLKPVAALDLAELLKVQEPPMNDRTGRSVQADPGASTRGGHPGGDMRRPASAERHRSQMNGG